jgi:hypothetical protein
MLLPLRGPYGSLLLALVVLLAGGCASSGSAPQGRTAPLFAGPLPAGPPSGITLPALSSLDRPADADGRQASAPVVGHKTVQLGKDYRSDLDQQLVSVNSNDLLFNPSFSAGGGTAGLAFAVFNFEAPDAERAPELRAIWNADPPTAGTVYLAVANFERGSWEWHAGQREQSSGVSRDLVELVSWAPYLSPLTGKVYVALLLTDDHSSSLRKLRAGDPYLIGASFFPERQVAPADAQADLRFASVPGSLDLSDFEVDYLGDSGPEALSAQSSFTYNIAGTYTIRASAVNEEGLRGYADWELRVFSPAWTTSTVVLPDSAACAIVDPCAGEVGFRQAVAYIRQDTDTSDGDPEEHTVEYLIASDAEGTAWTGPFIAYSTAGSERPVAIGGLEDCAGGPGIFFRTASGLLYFMRGDAPEPTSWSSPFVLEGLLTEQSGVSSVSIEGRPGVAYNIDTGISGWQCFYRYCDSGDGLGNWSTTSIGPGIGEIGVFVWPLQSASAAVHLPGGGIANYLAPSSTGESALTWTLQGTYGSMLAAPDNGPAYSSLGVPGRGIVCFTDVDFVNSGSFYSVNFGHSAGGMSCQYESCFDLCYFALGYDALICAYDKEAGDLGLVEAVVDGVSAGFGASSIDSEGDVGRHCSINACRGIPFVFYEDVSNRSLKVAQHF